LRAVNGQLLAATGNYTQAATEFDNIFKETNIEKTTPDFKFFHEVASDVYSRVGRYDLALQHHRAFKRLDDEAKELMVNTNSALMAAQFDFANQDLRIARLQAEKLRKDTELAESRNRITLILLGGSVLFGGLLGYNFLSLRRSSRRIDATNTRLNLANESLERALKAKSEFLATTSHEIRTPLNGILGVTQVLLADDKVSPDVRDRVRLMHGAGETMRALVNDILDAAKIESGTLTIEKGDTDLGALLDDAVHLWTDRAEEKGLGLQIDRAQAPARIVEDGPRLRQIVFNLLSNAIKFTETGSVSLTAAAEPFGAGERLVIRVADTGIGIPADRVDDIFESFKQVDGGVTRRFGGTGLGLSISRDLAEAMGGTLGVESELGRGSVFTLVLPLERPATLAEAGSAGDGLRNDVFLIIEANPLTQSVLKSAVAPLGLSADISGSLDAAIARLSAGGVVCALVDAALLGADDPGRLAAVSRLAGTGDFHLAVTWPSPSEEMVRALIAAGASQVIAKPISAGGLVAALKQGLETAA
jgi:signal transduction histidine kinase/CheY-like chemotaxis protein